MTKLNNRTTFELGEYVVPKACDVCGENRYRGNHRRCSRIRQQRHADRLRDDEHDRSLMDDGKK